MNTQLLLHLSMQTLEKKAGFFQDPEDWKLCIGFALKMWRAATSKGDMSQQMVKHGNTFCRVRCLLSKHLASTPIMPPKIPCPPYLLIKTDVIKLVSRKSTIIWLGKNSQIEGMNTRRKLNNADWRMKQELSELGNRWIQLCLATQQLYCSPHEAQLSPTEDGKCLLSIEPGY
jgi:hypothetical protein